MIFRPLIVTEKRTRSEERSTGIVGRLRFSRSLRLVKTSSAFGDRSVPDVPIVQPLRYVQNVKDNRNWEGELPRFENS
jgi:hypothetical protein